MRRELCVAALVVVALSSSGPPARGDDAGPGTVAAPERPGAAEIDQDGLRTFMSARLGLIKACYEKALRREPSLRGRMSLRFTILGDGALEDVAVTGNELGAAVARCVTSTVRGWRVPFRPAWPVTVEYPVVFTPGG